MNKLYMVLLIICYITMPNYIIKKSLYSNKNIDIYRSIIEKTESNVVEYGLKTNFIADNNGIEKCTQIFNSLKQEYYSRINMKTIISSETYRIEFDSEEISGYIRYYLNDGDKNIIISVIEHKSQLDFQGLKSRIIKAIGNKKQEVEFFQYVKAKTKTADRLKSYSIVTEILKSKGASNIETIDLESSLNITALIGDSNLVKNGDKWINFNCAICSYESGEYVIIGSPIIMESY